MRPATSDGAEGVGRARGAVELLDRASLAGIAAGIALAMQPWWPGGFRVGFFVVLASTLAQIVASHLPARGRA